MSGEEEISSFLWLLMPCFHIDRMGFWDPGFLMKLLILFVIYLFIQVFMKININWLEQNKRKYSPQFLNSYGNTPISKQMLKKLSRVASCYQNLWKCVTKSLQVACMLRLSVCHELTSCVCYARCKRRRLIIYLLSTRLCQSVVYFFKC